MKTLYILARIVLFGAKIYVFGTFFSLFIMLGYHLNRKQLLTPYWVEVVGVDFVISIVIAVILYKVDRWVKKRLNKENEKSN